ncbi:MAG: hypothetical protein JW828_11675 [Sedimentisphaerales bacterium]|nr:hypothetical protein [Sedimentisphaerales bacterium]
MNNARTESMVLTVGFILAIACAGIWQAIVEIGGGRPLQALDLFRRVPTAANLRAYERDLEDASWLTKQLRPGMQYRQFVWLKEAGEKVLIGRDGWLFYKPGVNVLLSRPRPISGNPGADDPVAAIVAFREALAERGIELLVVVAPNKESVYPDKLTWRAAGMSGVVGPKTVGLLRRLDAAGVKTVDLFAVFDRVRQTGGPPLYLIQDSHWSPEGVAVAAKAIAGQIIDYGWIERGDIAFEIRPAVVERVGDVLRMLQVPRLEQEAVPETIRCGQVIRSDTGATYKDDPDSQVLILGDSFLRIYETDEPGSAGLIAHLAGQLKQPLTSLVSDGGASTLVRQELYRRPALWKNKKIVVWEFVERDIELGAEGWQIIPLLPIGKNSE